MRRGRAAAVPVTSVARHSAPLPVAAFASGDQRRQASYFLRKKSESGPSG
jgi:hypothetical protein